MRMLPVATLALAALLLSGCTPHDPTPLPTPSATSTPVFASDEDALKAAEAAYKEYEAALNRALADYDTKPLLDVATGDALQDALKSVANFRQQNHKLVGLATFGRTSLVQGQEATNDEGIAQIQMYVCLDVTSTDVIDEAGNSVVPPTRDPIVPMLVTLEAIPGSVLVSRSEVWDGNDFCE